MFIASSQRMSTEEFSIHVLHKGTVFIKLLAHGGAQLFYGKLSGMIVGGRSQQFEGRVASN
jgi:hypothetical protein